MAGTRLTQTSFSRGELAPALYNRTEIEQYSLGSKEIKNGFIHQEGCVSNRSGFEFVGEVKDSSKITRLLAFAFNSEQTYIIEAGNKYFRFIQDGGYVVVENASSWVTSHSYKAGDFVTKSSKTYFCVTAHTSGTFNTDLNNGKWREQDIYEVVTPYASADLFELKTIQSADVLTITHRKYATKKLVRYDHDDWRLEGIVFEPEIDAPTDVAATFSTTTPTSKKKTYYYLVTAVKSGSEEESKRSSVVSCVAHNEANWGASEYIRITWTAVTGASEYNVYKKVNGLYGYIGTAGGTTFDDDNIEPDLSSCAPIHKNPFASNNYPSCATYFQQRKIYANSTNNPQTFWASQTGNPDNFDISRPLIASDAITQALVDKEVNEIRHLIGLNHLIALTSSTEYKISGNDGVLSANPSPIALVQSNYGSSHVEPIISGNMIIFVQSGGSVIRDLGFDYLSDSYNGAELSLFASHLFEGKTVKYMAYAKEPYRIIWIVFSDGTCAALTYNKTQKICGWAREITDGFFESVACVREGQEDVVYFVIRRYILPVYQGSFEFIKSELNSNNVMTYYYKCGEHTYYSKKVLELGVTVYSDELLTTSLGNVNVLNEEENVITIGGTRKRYVERTKSRIIKKTQEGFFVDSGLSATFENEVSAITGLSHLAGKDVIAICNGGVIEHLHVDSNGRVELPFGVKEITIGLPFEFKLETLNIEGENTQGLKKIINNVCVNTLNSREEFYIGGSEDLYVETDRSIESVNDSNKLFTKNVSATPLNSATTNATIIVMQNNPLPLTILSLSATFSMEDISDTQ